MMNLLKGVSWNSERIYLFVLFYWSFKSRLNLGGYATMSESLIFIGKILETIAISYMELPLLGPALLCAILFATIEHSLFKDGQ